MTAHASVALHGQQYWPSKQLTAAWLQEEPYEIDMVHSCSGVPDHTSNAMGFFSLSLPPCWLICASFVFERSADLAPRFCCFQGIQAFLRNDSISVSQKKKNPSVTESDDSLSFITLTTAWCWALSYIISPCFLRIHFNVM